MEQTLNFRILRTLEHLTRLTEALDEWQRQGTPVNGRHWVAAGHDAVTLIDQASMELSLMRRDLVTALRKEQDETAVRVDALLALAQTRQPLRHERPVSGGGDVALPAPMESGDAEDRAASRRDLLAEIDSGARSDLPRADSDAGRFLHDQGVHDGCDPRECDAGAEQLDYLVIGCGECGRKAPEMHAFGCTSQGGTVQR